MLKAIRVDLRRARIKHLLVRVSGGVEVWRQGGKGLR